MQKLLIYFYILFSLILISCSKNDIIDEVIDLWSSKKIYNKLTITYPFNNSIFPPDIISPTITWNDTIANRWLVIFKNKIGIYAKSNVLISNSWQPDSALWEKIKNSSIENYSELIIIGFQYDSNKKKPSLTTSAAINFKISKDSVNSPIFYRAVPLPFGFAVDHLNLIQWRMGFISDYKESQVVLEDLPVCGNCHSFTPDGKTIAMDIDYGNDKGSYWIEKISDTTFIDADKIITWSDYKRDEKELTFGLLSQISPDGNWVLSTVKDRSIFVRVNQLDYSQLFFPIKGIIGIYNRKTGQFSSLNGANNPEFCQSNPSWSPDAKEIIFAKAPYIKLPEAEKSKAVILPTEMAQDFIDRKKEYKFDLFKIKFNNGKGSEAIPFEGASNNGKSNYFAKYSPDGKWVVFTQAENFMLLQPDAKLYIIPSKGGKPKLMNCNLPNTMNSWHSWTPNGKWLVFSSKYKGPYTQLYLTHIDENGNDSPPILLEKFSIKEKACNIPEFLNIRKEQLKKIIERFMDTDNYKYIKSKSQFEKGNIKQALADVNKSIQLDPKNPHNYNLRAIIKVEMGKYEEAIIDFSKVIELMPDRFDAYFNRASAKINIKDFKGALIDLNKVIELNPSGSKGYFTRGVVKYNLTDYLGAIKDFDFSIKLNPKNDEAFLYRGLSYMQIEEIEKGCKDLQKSKDMGNETARNYWLDFCK